MVSIVIITKIMIIMQGYDFADFIPLEAIAARNFSQ